MKNIVYMTLGILSFVLISWMGYCVGIDEFPILRKVAAFVGGGILGYLTGRAALLD